MYVGRITSIARTKDNRLVLMYRVSSRSFPNRQAKEIGQAVAILPKPGHEGDILENPYIAYNCLRHNKEFAVVANGTQADPIFEKLESGMNMRDALITVLSGMDFEHDHLDTPRIATIAHVKSNKLAMGIIRRDSLQVIETDVKPGEARYIATYEHNYLNPEFNDVNFDAATAEEACDYILGKGTFADLERPISAVCAVQTDDGFEIAMKDYVQG